MKSLGVFLLLLDGVLVHCRVTLNMRFAGTHPYILVKRGTMPGVKCLGQEHNSGSLAGT